MQTVAEWIVAIIGVLLLLTIAGCAVLVVIADIDERRGY